jgi:hypothetical protein
VNNPIATVGVSLNNGGGVFSGFSASGTGNGPSCLALADVDADGDLDVLVACAADTEVQVRLNNGTGLLAAPYRVLTPPDPSALALADVDADSDLDLLVLSRQNGSVSVWTNNGTGAFAAASTLVVDTNPGGLALGDLDNDGDLDWATTHGGGTSANIIALRRNGGTGPLAAAPAAAPATLACYPNPATNWVQLRLPPGAAHAELLDALGRTVRTAPARAGTAILHVAGLSAGLYLVRAAGQTARLVVE